VRYIVGRGGCMREREREKGWREGGGGESVIEKFNPF
jgi:hypothetical protein